MLSFTQYYPIRKVPGALLQLVYHDHNSFIMTRIQLILFNEQKLIAFSLIQRFVTLIKLSLPISNKFWIPSHSSTIWAHACTVTGHYVKLLENNSSAIVISWLLLSDMIGTKVITLSGAHRIKIYQTKFHVKRSSSCKTTLNDTFFQFLVIGGFNRSQTNNKYSQLLSYCYQSVYVIRYDWDLSDQIKRRPL